MTNAAVAWLTSSTERVLTAPGGFGLDKATPVQRAICRVLDGRDLGDVADHEHVVSAFGGKVPTERARELCLFAGKRGGKTAIAAAFIAVCSQRIDCSGLLPGEHVRIPVVSLSRDLAAQTFGHIRGAIEASPALRSLLVTDPTADTIQLRHPSGRVVEVVVTAGARAGASVAARWLGGAVFDEFPRMLGADEATVNWDHMRGEVVGRVLPGGAILNIGQPWAPFGPAYSMFLEHWGRPGAVVVVKAPAYRMNPWWWTPERCEDFKRNAPDRYATDVEAEFAAQEEALFNDLELARATRSTEPALEPNPLASYEAAMDPATRRNAWTLTITTKQEGRIRVALAAQWVGTKLEPLSPRKVMAEIAELVRPYRVAGVMTDQYYSDALRDFADDAKVGILPISLTAEAQTKAYLSMQLRIAAGLFELAPDMMLRTDLQRLRKRVTQTGVAIVLPKTSDGRHCDYAPPLMLATHRYLEEMRPESAPRDHGDRARVEREMWREASKHDRARRLGYG